MRGGMASRPGAPMELRKALQWRSFGRGLIAQTVRISPSKAIHWRSIRRSIGASGLKRDAPGEQGAPCEQGISGNKVRNQRSS